MVLDVDLRQSHEDGRVPEASQDESMRSAWFVVGLALKRMRRRDSGSLVAIAGLAVATAVLAGVLAGVTIATDRSTADAIERIPTSARSVRAVWFGVPGDPAERLSVLDADVARAFEGFGLDGPTPLILFRESTVADRFVGITAVDGLEPHVVLRSGRLPRTCTAERCEVLRLRGRGAIPNVEGLRLVEVGKATLRSRQLYGDFLRSTDAAVGDATVTPELGATTEYHRPPPAPLVVAEGRAALEAAAPLARTYRTYAWVWPVNPGSPRLWQVDDLVLRTERARTELAAESSFDVDAPVEELRTAQRAADVAGTRLLLVGAEVAALLLAFTVLAARGMRRDLEAARRRLTWSGARRWQLALLSGVESGAVAIVGVLLGWALGVVIAAFAARLAGAPVDAVLRESVLSPTGLGLACATTLAAAVLVWVTVSLTQREGARFGPLDLVAVCVLAVIGVALVSGAADEERLARGEGSALLLLLLPGLIAVAAAILVARAFPTVARWWADRRRGGVSAQLAAVGLARGPGAAVATVAFLTLAFALALLAEGYRATLSRGDREQAAFAVAHDVVVTEDPRNLVRVFEAAPAPRFAALAGDGGAAYPVLRVNGGAAGRAERVSGVTVLGLDRGAIEGVRVWRPDWSSGRSLEQVADLVDPGRAMALRGLTLRNGEIVLRSPPGIVSFAAVVRLPDRSFRRVELGDANPNAPATLRARVQPGALLTRLEIVPPPRIIERGADAGNAFVGTLGLSGPLARAVREWKGEGGVDPTPTEEGVDARIALTLGRIAYLRAPQPTDEDPPAVLVTPRLAELAGGVGRLLPLQVAAETVPVQVVGVVDRFPGSSGETIVGDRTALSTAINTVAPGGARENEVWLDVAPGRMAGVAAALDRPPFRALAATVRTDVEAEARRDPLARGTLFALTGSALVALVLASLGLALAVRADLRDDRGEHYDLEAQGSSPGFLRRVARARAATLSLVGLVTGLVTGLGLLALVTRVVSVTARGNTAEPPLAVVVDPLPILVGVMLFAVLAVVLVGGATRRAFSGIRGPAYRETDS